MEDRLDIQRVELTHDVLTPVIKKSRDERQQQEAVLRAEQHALEVREKARGQLRRLRWIVAAIAMAVALAVVSGFGAVSYSLYRVSEERLREVQRQKELAQASEREAKLAREEALKEKEKAEENHQLADKRFDGQLSAVDAMSLLDEGLKTMGGSQEIRQVILRRALDQYEKILRERPDDPTVRARLALAYLKLGTLQSETDDFAGAIQSLGQAAVTNQPIFLYVCIYMVMQTIQRGRNTRLYFA